MVAGLGALLLYIIFGSFNAVVVKFAVKEISPITLTFFRFLVAAIVPLTVAILGYLFLREKVTAYQILGVILGFLGVLFIVLQSASTPNILTLGTPLGNIIIFIAVIIFSFYIVLSRGLSRIYSPITISFYSFVSSVVLLGIALPIEVSSSTFSITSFSKEAIFDILFLGVVSSVIMYYLHQFGIRRTSAFISSFVFLIASITASIPAIFLLKEELTLSFLSGTVLILLGVFLGVVYHQINKR